MAYMTESMQMQTEGYNYIGIFLTLDCPRGCSYCLNQLSTRLEKRACVEGNQWIDGLNKLDVAIPLTFNGGEPLSHPHFFSVVNGIEKSLKVDLLTTLPTDAHEFVANLSPDRFKRDLPYSAIRVTYHPQTMDLEETINKVTTLKSAGFDIMMNLVDHPYHIHETNCYRKKIQEAGIRCVIKPFLGYLDGVLYGQYSYEGACRRRLRKKVRCKTSVLLIDPLGNIYRCHRDMFVGDPQGLLGNIFEGEFELFGGYTSCHHFGFCHPCDVQTKFDHSGQWGYTAVDSKGEDIATVRNPEPDWR